MQAQTVARGALMSPSKLSKIERNLITPSTTDVDRILSVLNVPDEVRRGLIQVARRAATEATAWRIHRRAGLHKHQDEIRAVEARTALMRLFQLSAVPGLLQTPEYIRGVLRNRRLSDEESERTLSARLRRQTVLRRSSGRPCLRSSNSSGTDTCEIPSAEPGRCRRPQTLKRNSTTSPSAIT